MEERPACKSGGVPVDLNMASNQEFKISKILVSLHDFDFDLLMDLSGLSLVSRRQPRGVCHCAECRSTFSLVEHQRATYLSPTQPTNSNKATLLLVPWDGDGHPLMVCLHVIPHFTLLTHQVLTLPQTIALFIKVL